MSGERTQAIVCVEPDATLDAMLIASLKELGARNLSRDWGVMGSVELITGRFEFPDGRTIAIERDNYIDLAITGDPSAIDSIETAMGVSFGSFR